MMLLAEIEKLTLKSIWNCKGPQITTTILKKKNLKKKNLENSYLPRSKLSQSFSHQNSVELGDVPGCLVVRLRISLP